jgi:hypothetical protein
VPEGVVILSVDITERKHSENALRRSNQALRALGESNRTVAGAGNEIDALRAICKHLANAGYDLAWMPRARKTRSAPSGLPAPP